jgi:putative DNA primase/helicase
VDGNADADLSSAEALVNETIGALPPAYSDDELALEFSNRHDGQLLYVPAWGHWLRWDGCRWARDNTLAVFDLCRQVCRDGAGEAKGLDNGTSIARRVASAATTAAVEKLARADRRHARSSGAFDADPWQLNTPGGVIDLRTGDMRPHQPDDLVTKVTTVAPAGKCPRWLRFLLQITQGDKALVRYLQCFIGYSLTGITTEHAFVFLWGPGGNGKSVLLGTVAAMLGDYATTAMADVFTVTRSEQHPTHLATLRGARFVVVTETEEGRPWAESRIKSLTGGDRISARVMRGDPFEYVPAFKLWIAGNHRPVLRNPDPAMRRRLHLVPLTFVPSKPDKELADALREELPGILAWAIRGCIAWQREGLNPPDVVRQASDEYFAEQDIIGNWFAERCERTNGPATTPSRELYADWRDWAGMRGEAPGTEKWFSEGLQRIAAKKRTASGVVFLNVRLKARPTPTSNAGV